jgi:hypothetical protein
MKKIGKEVFFFDFCRRRRHITVIGSDLKNKIENRMVHVKSKFLLNVIIFLGDQGPEEKYRRINLVLVVVWFVRLSKRIG